MTMTTLYITAQIPPWLEAAISRRLITRKQATELCDWAYSERSNYLGIADTHIYYPAVAGDTTEAILAFGRILKDITTRAEAHGTTEWGEPQSIIWRKTLGKTLLLDIRADVISSVCEYLPSLIEVSEQPEDCALFRQVLDTYK